MTSQPTDAATTPKKTSAVWKWIRRIGCAILLTSFACCGLTCLGGRWLVTMPWRANKEEVDRVFAQGLQGGDVKAMFERADPKFREKHTLEDLQKFIDEHPGILDRDNFHGMTFVKFEINGQQCVRIRSIPSLFSNDHWDIICKVVDGVLVFLGITPGMDGALPPSLPIPGGAGGGGGGGGRLRGRHWWH